MNMMAMTGMIILIGVVVNNAIVLVDMINRLRIEGLTRTEAIIEAGANRFRPILMTTFTTIFGLLPMAVGNSNLMGMSYAPLGRTMMGGLMSSTVLTLLVVPLLYTFLDDLTQTIKGLALSAFQKPQGDVTESDADLFDSASR
jgi:HAE1 family hydrophobic/amphiphilic exporter-1